MNRFMNVPLRDDARIIYEHEIVMGGLPVLIQKWASDTQIAESVIFVDEDILDLDDNRLSRFIKSNRIVLEGPNSIRRSESGFTIVDINVVEYEALH